MKKIVKTVQTDKVGTNPEMQAQPHPVKKTHLTHIIDHSYGRVNRSPIGFDHEPGTFN